ncbi:MAG: PQQ-binding-like beta-propeller repeat protein [Planctomycetaceae bacterium]|nr:PQQ-binding-like beta-propeller repeat protein [Planctomycetales bacterium]MCB9924663.1 PQQ-binding-like beta-propeller repeat protein [Planctomycetaceae bacterium]
MVVITSLLFCHTPPATAADWTRFRGPNGSGVSQDTATVPTTFSNSENLKWKVRLPGPGSSSPIIVGDRVFVTCWTGYGVDRGNPGDQKDLRRHLICIDRNNGKTIWSKAVEPVLPEDNYGGMFAEHGYASHTPVSDGERIYVYFGKSGAFAFDMDGNQLWQTKIGTESDPRGWGSASSPVLYKDTVIVTASAESQAVVALDKKTGKEVWRQEAAGLSSTWGTPVIVKVDEERIDLVLGVPYEFWAFNPDDGKLRWYCEVMETDSYCSSVVTDGGIVYGIEGRGGGSIAVRAGGKGNVTDSNVVWTGRDSNRIGTPIIYEGRIYFFSGGIANCIDAKTGKEVFQSRLTGASGRSQNRSGGQAGGSQLAGGRGRRGGGGMGGDYASPIIADGKIYFTSRSGDIFVLKATDTFEQLATNRVTNDSEDFSATPAVSDGQLFIRSSKHLYCFAAP